MRELDRRMDMVERGEVDLEGWTTVRESVLHEARRLLEAYPQRA